MERYRGSMGVIVTGGSRGIGCAVALNYAEAGADVVITSRNLSICEIVAEQIGSLGSVL